MNTTNFRVGLTVGMMSVSAAVCAGEPKPAQPAEPVGFITGGIIGGLAAGPVGAVIGAGIGTWLGNRVHRAGEASKAQAQVAALEAENGDLSETNRALAARFDQLTQAVDATRTAADLTSRDAAAGVLDGLEGDVLFRTGSADVAADMAGGIKVLAAAVANTPGLKVRVDGFADPRGSTQSNVELSQARADAVRDMFLAAGVDRAALEINAYGKSQSVALDSDGYALERRVRLTLQVSDGAPVAQSRGEQ